MIPDWNQTDETAPDYIKNKTHYSENLYGVILSNTVETNAWEGPWACFDIETTFMPEIGNEYTVIWDGDSYTVTCFEEEGGRILGEGYYGHIGDLPFQLFFFFDGTMMVLASSEGTHTYEVLGTHEIVHKLDYAYLPDIVKDLQSVVHVDDSNVYIDGDTYIGTPEESNKLATESFFYEPKKHVVIADEVNGYNYIVAMRDGNLVSYVETESIYIDTQPTKTIYANKETFDPTGMIVIATAKDGSTREITNYKYDLVTTENANNFYIRLEEGTNVFTAKVNNLTVHDFSLEDFEYIANEDGTYELTAWKGTYNGEPSTRIVVPNSELIIV